MTKLTEADRAEIVMLKENGIKVSTLATQFGVTRVTIRNVYNSLKASLGSPHEVRTYLNDDEYIGLVKLSQRANVSLGLMVRACIVDAIADEGLNGGLQRSPTQAGSRSREALSGKGATAS